MDAIFRDADSLLLFCIEKEVTSLESLGSLVNISRQAVDQKLKTKGYVWSDIKNQVLQKLFIDSSWWEDHTNLESGEEIKRFRGNIFCSNKGRIFREKKMAVGGHTFSKLRLVKQNSENKYSYFVVQGDYVLFHRAIAFCWVEGYKKGLTVRHKDGLKSNNHPSNLVWVPHKEKVYQEIQSNQTDHEP